MRNELIYGNTIGSATRNGALYVDGPRTSNLAKTILENCTIADNTGSTGSQGHAILVEGGSEVIAKNCIFRGNQAPDNQVDFFVDSGSSLAVSWSIYQTGSSGGGAFSLSNSFQSDPLFADPAAGYYYLKSNIGRWNPMTELWVTDPVHSPGINAGNPMSLFSNEPVPNGGRVNLGAYGNTVHASMGN